MLMCYVDESGDTGSLVPTERNSQPIFLISAVIVKQSSLKQLTRSVIELKKRFFPAYGNNAEHWHDWLKVEVKGANLRIYYADLEAICVHADPVFDIIRTRFGQRIKALQYRYEQEGRKLGGVSVLAGGTRKVSPLQVFGPKPPETVA